MREKTVDGVVFLEFDIYRDAPWFKACFSTRIGGVSEGVYESLNFRPRGDSLENVVENYRRICAAASLSYDGLTFSYQEHGVNIRAIEAADRGKGLHRERDYTDIDGIITNVAGIALTTFHADCAAVYLCDPVHKAVGIVHAGWRGTVGNIGAMAIRKMGEIYGSNPGDMLCGISPSICYTCFEVDEPVFSEFGAFSSFTCQKPGSDDKYFIDLKGINRQMLIDAGVLAEHIEVSPLCTKCDERLFYSHRRDSDRRGTMAAFMEITYEK